MLLFAEYVVITIHFLFGVLLLLAISVLVMGALFLAVLYLREQTVLNETARQLSIT